MSEATASTSRWVVFWLAHVYAPLAHHLRESRRLVSRV